MNLCLDDKRSLFVKIGDHRPDIKTAPLLSKDMPTFQVSTLGNSVSGKAVDGNKDADFSAGSCTHTGFDSQGGIPLSPWWTVDLGSSKYVSVVRITNRSDCCDTRLKNFEIRIGNARPEGSGDQNEVCAVGSSIPRGQTYQYDCDAVGRYVMIRIPNKQTILTLCEVEVFGKRHTAWIRILTITVLHFQMFLLADKTVHARYSSYSIGNKTRAFGAEAWTTCT